MNMCDRNGKAMENQPLAYLIQWFRRVLGICFIQYMQIGVVGICTIAAESTSTFPKVPADFFTIYGFGVFSGCNLQ